MSRFDGKIYSSVTLQPPQLHTDSVVSVEDRDFQDNSVYCSKNFPSKNLTAFQKALEVFERALRLPKHFHFSTPWACFPPLTEANEICSGSLALCLIHNLFSKIQLSVNVSRSFQNFPWSLSKNGINVLWDHMVGAINSVVLIWHCSKRLM